MFFSGIGSTGLLWNLFGTQLRPLDNLDEALGVIGREPGRKEDLEPGRLIFVARFVKFPPQL